MLDEETIGKIMRALSVAFPTLVCILLLALVMAVNGVSRQIEAASAKAASGPILPAGVYICDGERCVIATSQNIDGIGKKK